MKIDTGNFGQAQRQVVSTQIDRGNVAEMAETKISNARNTQRLQGMANQAWDRLGGQMQQVGQQMQQEIRQLAAQKSALAIQQKQLFGQGVLQEAQDKVDSGQLKAADVQKYVSDSMGKFKHEDIDGLGEAGRLQLDKGLQGVDMSINQSTNHLYRAAHKVESRVATDEMISNNERLALNSGADLDKAASMYDSPLFQAQAREAYGAEFGKVITQAKAGIYAAGAKKMVLDARDSYSGLQAISKQFQEGGKFHGKLDADTELSITGQIESRMGTIEAKAAAQAARAAAQAQAAAAKQMAAESKAQSAQLQMREFIAAGNVPDDATLEKYAQVTQGTGLADDAKNMVGLAQQTQQFSALPLTQQEQLLQTTAAKMKTGTNPADVKVYNAMQAAHNAQKKALVDDPIVAVTQRAGVEIPPLPMDAIASAKSPQDQKAANEQFAAAVYERAGYNAQARQQTAEAPKVVLTAQERSDYKAYADSLAPNERINFYKTLANAGGRLGVSLVKEVSGSDTVAAAAYHQAANPNSNVGGSIARGQQLIDDPKGNYKPPSREKFQPAIDGALSDALPASQRATIAGAVNAHYVASRTERGLNPNELDDDDYADSIKAVVGDVIQYGDGKVIVPSGTDANKFRESLYQSVMQTPGGADSMELIETGAARLTAVGSKSYMLTTPSGATYFDPKTGQPVRIQVN